jgi:hypothetical protein
MSYQSISVKEAVNNINGNVNGWFLPPTQRPFVWGSRYESEKYICKLFDSILRGYPIGGIIIWNTDNEIPYREFLRDYKIGDIPSFVDRGLWNRADKWLVYDGQQRLQTLYSCLKYTLNGKILVFNTLFELDSIPEDPNETPFSFMGKNASIPSYFIRMNELFTKKPDEKTSFRKLFFNQCQGLDDNGKGIIENNIDKLWDIFVKTDTKSIVYFPIQSNDESIVNEVFQRLNTGSVPLSQADLLFSRIKEKNYDFEENLQGFSKKIFDATGSGYFFDSYSILQLINLLVKSTIRIDSDKTKESDLNEYNNIWNNLQKPLFDFFSDFIWGQFKINNNAIIPKKLALLPLMVYFYEIYRKKFNFEKIDINNLLKIKQYFILSQINDWNLQSITDNFSRIISEESSKSKSQEMFEFPLQRFIDWLNEKKVRFTELNETNFVDYQWFSLKILIPDRIYQFEPNEKGRFNPEIDHIFPMNLKDQMEEYYNAVDIIWNMQPIKGEINNYKKRRHPREFFLSKEGQKYLADYDFIPSKDLSASIWDKPIEFINKRREEMIRFLEDQYQLKLK